MRKRFDERARASCVTVAQWRVLVTLKRHEGSNQGTLADLLEVEPITLARMIDRLEEAGLVERRADPADRRAWRIHLTERAHPVLARLRGVGDALIEDSMAGLDVLERELLMHALTVVRANLSAEEPEKKEAAHG
jgi:DNA-binding MarR family transcriptional regulator